MSEYETLKSMFQAHSIQLDCSDDHEEIVKDIVHVLSNVIDPHMHVDLMTLGLLRGIEIDENGAVRLTMTLTTPTCPYAPELETAIKTGIDDIGSASDFQIEYTFDPPWEPSEELMLQMGML